MRMMGHLRMSSRPMARWCAATYSCNAQTEAAAARRPRQDTPAGEPLPRTRLREDREALATWTSGFSWQIGQEPVPVTEPDLTLTLRQALACGT